MPVRGGWHHGGLPRQVILEPAPGRPELSGFPVGKLPVIPSLRPEKALYSFAAPLGRHVLSREASPAPTSPASGRNFHPQALCLALELIGN